MAINTKEEIAEAAYDLLVNKKVKRLTIRDIAEECHITRQAFYYHFEDIPDMMRWIIKTNFEKMFSEYAGEDTPEERLQYLITLTENIRPFVDRAISSSYRDDFDRIITDAFYSFFDDLVREKGVYDQYTVREIRIIRKYHCGALMGYLRSWSKEDTDNIELISRIFKGIIMGEVVPF